MKLIMSQLSLVHSRTCYLLKIPLMVSLLGLEYGSFQWVFQENCVGILSFPLTCYWFYFLYLTMLISPKVRSRGRAIAQAVSHRLPTTAARVQAQVMLCGISGGQIGTGTGFLRVLLFPVPILIIPTAPHASFISQGWYNRPISDLRTKCTQSHLTPRN
jgi:hypothetical protein